MLSYLIKSKFSNKRSFQNKHVNLVTQLSKNTIWTVLFSFKEKQGKPQITAS